MYISFYTLRPPFFIYFHLIYYGIITILILKSEPTVKKKNCFPCRICVWILNILYYMFIPSFFLEFGIVWICIIYTTQPLHQPNLHQLKPTPYSSLLLSPDIVFIIQLFHFIAKNTPIPHTSFHPQNKKISPPSRPLPPRVIQSNPIQSHTTKSNSITKKKKNQ
jgi:hypothetical protein